MSFSLTLDADTKAQDRLYVPSDSMQAVSVPLLNSYSLSFGLFSMFLEDNGDEINLLPEAHMKPDGIG